MQLFISRFKKPNIIIYFNNKLYKKDLKHFYIKEQNFYFPKYNFVLFSLFYVFIFLTNYTYSRK